MSTVSSTFIIRLWTSADPLAIESRHGHGRIDHVQSGEHLYFDQLQDALDFLSRHFGAYDSLDRTAGVDTALAGSAPPEPFTNPDPV